MKRPCIRCNKTFEKPVGSRAILCNSCWKKARTGSKKKLSEEDENHDRCRICGGIKFIKSRRCWSCLSSKRYSGVSRLSSIKNK